MRLDALGPPHGQEPTRDAIRNRQVEQARRVGWPELRAVDLVEWRFGMVEHTPSGRFYRRHGGQLVDALYVSAAAYYLSEAGEVAFLEEPLSGPKSRAELEQRQAEQRQRPNAPKPRRQAASR